MHRNYRGKGLGELYGLKNGVGLSLEKNPLKFKTELGDFNLNQPEKPWIESSVLKHESTVCQNMQKCSVLEQRLTNIRFEKSHQYFHIAHLEINTYSETWKEEVQAAPHFPHGSLLYLLSSKILFSITKLFKFSFFNIRFEIFEDGFQIEFGFCILRAAWGVHIIILSKMIASFFTLEAFKKIPNHYLKVQIFTCIY